ncbi:ergothioneine biosynthesis protein EgtB [Streptomyces sp. DSM 44915]|uniref:Hercynine oxygenase n=1 Tax=Streptomyces chisholmiae TaxID=3075540 RepID=A0ABU2JU57_9ACTN|nr:ergothioneine biosynthesis protein EgtB [Streptomyces sp. DSM 44915]MDT0268273.1 ergothioneine biosynthesis protein EgtB [Streptomyces sp. DSM 44915]
MTETPVAPNATPAAATTPASTAEAASTSAATPAVAAAGPPIARESLAAALATARLRTQALTDCLPASELTAQHSPLMSPLVWDLAHVANQEEIWLLRHAGARPPLRPDLDSSYDAFRHPRAERAALPLLSPAEARDYAAEVRALALDVLAEAPAARAFLFAMIAQHEQQHAETMLATHQLRRGRPALHAPAPPRPPGPPAPPALPAEVLVPGGPFTMGVDPADDPWALDNERPAHQVDIPAFWLDTTPVSNAAYQEFIAAGGYHEPRWWHPDGWSHRRQARLTAPAYWYRDVDGRWLRHRFGRVEPVPPDEPVLHVSWYEADAYARWAGRRLPTEAEWEKAARHDPATGRARRHPWGDQPATPRHANLGQRHLRPAPVGGYPDGAAPCGARQLLGDVWEWTASEFTGYPGFAAHPYREYSEVFLDAGYRVLRGGSFGTDPVACRGTFRNWDLPVRRQIFAGFRTCRDADPATGVR